LQHFRQLTAAFLRPFNVFFRVDHSRGVSDSARQSFGPYDDLSFLVPKFEEQVCCRSLCEPAVAWYPLSCHTSYLRCAPVATGIPRGHEVEGAAADAEERQVESTVPRFHPLAALLAVVPGARAGTRAERNCCLAVTTVHNCGVRVSRCWWSQIVQRKLFELSRQLRMATSVEALLLPPSARSSPYSSPSLRPSASLSAPSSPTRLDSSGGRAAASAAAASAVRVSPGRVAPAVTTEGDGLVLRRLTSGMLKEQHSHASLLRGKIRAALLKEDSHLKRVSAHRGRSLLRSLAVLSWTLPPSY
jgi:hypothetical protein